MSRHRHPGMYNSPDCGFGLLELLVALSILSAVMIAFAQAFRTNINKVSLATTRLETDNLARSIEARLTSRTLTDLEKDLRDIPHLKIDARPLDGNYSGTWRPYVLTIYRISNKGPDFAYEAIRLLRTSSR